ncbi:hypothetical protein LCGC14_2523270, partial [marine sediment metagenome]
ILGHHADDDIGIGELFFGRREEEKNNGLRIRTKLEEFM